MPLGPWGPMAPRRCGRSASAVTLTSSTCGGSAGSAGRSRNATASPTRVSAVGARRLAGPWWAARPGRGCTRRRRGRAAPSGSSKPRTARCCIATGGSSRRCCGGHIVLGCLCCAWCSGSSPRAGGLTCGFSMCPTRSTWWPSMRTRASRGTSRRFPAGGRGRALAGTRRRHWTSSGRVGASTPFARGCIARWRSGCRPRSRGRTS
mmetsp:Transcript_36344/g.104656  ORF Transcript_36344/g.104656 Transcript_36344/m.104656 type:complete len:206 (-) Transcript_36344:1129-1746(-)